MNNFKKLKEEARDKFFDIFIQDFLDGKIESMHLKKWAENGYRDIQLIQIGRSSSMGLTVDRIEFWEQLEKRIQNFIDNKKLSFEEKIKLGSFSVLEVVFPKPTIQEIFRIEAVLDNQKERIKEFVYVFYKTNFLQKGKFILAYDAGSLKDAELAIQNLISRSTKHFYLFETTNDLQKFLYNRLVLDIQDLKSRYPNLSHNEKQNLVSYVAAIEYLKSEQPKISQTMQSFHACDRLIEMSQKLKQARHFNRKSSLCPVFLSMN